MKSRRSFIKAASLLATSASLFGYNIAHSKNHLKIINSNKEKFMLQHTVYFWLKEGVTESERKNFGKGIKEFVSAITEVQKAEVGIPAATANRDVVDHTFGYSLFVWFSSMEDHNIYQEHPVHKKFIEDFSHLWSRVQVYDSELI